jgi:hypothetical protein
MNMNDDSRLDCSDYPEPQHEGDYIRQLEIENTAQKVLIRQMVDAVEAKDELLVCYRIGRQPSEKLFRKLDKAKIALALAKERSDRIK